jgi:ribonuclease BN (tRNA processing enzyme)
MKIQSSILFLGTGTGAAVVGKGIRSSGGIIIRAGSNQLHIDPGIGAVTKAAEFGANLRENTAILLSHAHLNHSNDTKAVIDAMTYSGLDKQGVLIANKTSIVGTEEYAPVIPEHYKKYLERFITIDRNKRIGINDIEIQTITARHNEPNSVGFKFFAPDFTLAYSADTVYAPDIVDQYMNSNILILNVPYIKKTDHNLCVEDAIKIIQKVNPKLAVITHFSFEMIKADPLYEIREIQKQTKVQTIAAKDGMVINPISYSASQGQKTLQGYKKEQSEGFDSST